VLVKQTPEVFNYDADGNLTNDGRWAYTWDGENRLVKMTANTLVGPQYQLNFTYDAQSRRIQKIVATNGVAISTNNFVYDGWNLAAELNPNGTLVRSYIWGSDLSGTAQGAGGVGGLIAISYHGSATTNCFTAFDGNGNIAVLINAADGTVSANYEYAPFGEVVRSTGPLARNNPFRFSTKYQDDESDLLYYGYRYYNASTGRWPNRDPMQEYGGLNLYGFVGNNSINVIDLLGMSESSDPVLAMVDLFQNALKACSCDQKLTADMRDTFNKYLSRNKELNEIVKNMLEALEQAKAQMKLDNDGVNNAIDKADENEKLTKLILMKVGGLTWKDSNNALTLIKGVAGANGIIDHIDNTLNNADALTSGDALEMFLQAGTYVSKVKGPIGTLGDFFTWYSSVYTHSKSALRDLATTPQVTQNLEHMASNCTSGDTDSAGYLWASIKHILVPFSLFSM